VRQHSRRRNEVHIDATDACHTEVVLGPRRGAGVTYLTRLVRAVATVALLAASACVTVTPPRFLQYPSDRAWGPTLDQARTLAAEGRVAQADSVLAQYAQAFPTAPQAVEANYWRAVLNLRAPSPTQGISQAIPLLQAYLAAGQSTQHWAEADALLRATARVDSISKIAATYVSKGEVAGDVTTNPAKPAEIKTVVVDSKAQDDEIKRLKDELAKSKDELERIKKRLAEAPKKPPYR
jgi:hypothetical protein